MNTDEIIADLKSKAEQFIIQKGFDLVELKIKPSSRGRIISILADRPYGGITIEECAILNRDLQSFLEDDAVFKEAAELEVSSPGLDRPLVNRKDFLRAMKQALTVFLKNPVSAATGGKEKYEFCGNLTEVSDEAIAIETKDGLLTIDLNNIAKAKQVI
ncbi:MAG: hypothetical protein COV72_06335 [Candidatus Omnitrophica bacterium CG11_big_fil_rev_8_21_14_0_20_42_13]|uniref:Ribosome maturation factor RimP n=1 Tax=Candidatus Ghiorseimicrobium undicola TaxID=1974746 RepID=A0A2H0LWX0_9BACT|nr:MAG: hypothetical protein COV72_06335 [Candidatus Omnitrophica bacterium CG11_big_fil_rev_8_21_14_0_20_42_13]